MAQQFQYAVRVIGSNFAPTVERDEFLVAEKIKKERTYFPSASPRAALLALSELENVYVHPRVCLCLCSSVHTW